MNLRENTRLLPPTLWDRFDHGKQLLALQTFPSLLAKFDREFDSSGPGKITVSLRDGRHTVNDDNRLADDCWRIGYRPKRARYVQHWRSVAVVPGEWGAYD